MGRVGRSVKSKTLIWLNSGHNFDERHKTAGDLLISPQERDHCSVIIRTTNFCALAACDVFVLVLTFRDSTSFRTLRERRSNRDLC